MQKQFSVGTRRIRELRMHFDKIAIYRRSLRPVNYDVYILRRTQSFSETTFFLRLSDTLFEHRRP